MGNATTQSQRHGRRRRRLLVFIVCVTVVTAIALQLHFQYRESVAVTRRFNAYRDVLGNFGVYYLTHRVEMEPQTNAISLPPLSWQDERAGQRCSWRLSNYLSWPTGLGRPGHWDSDAAELKAVQSMRPPPYYPAADEAGQATVFAIGGRGTIFDNDLVVPMVDCPDDLILFTDVETTQVNWVQAGDFSVEALRAEDGCDNVGSKLYSGFFVCFIDGEVWYLSRDTPCRLWVQFTTVQGAQRADRDDLRRYAEYIVTRRPEDVPPWWTDVLAARQELNAKAESNHSQ